MKKVLVLATALVLSAVVTCGLPGAAQDTAASPVPSTSPASVLDKTIAVDGVPVPLRDFAALITTMLFVYLPAKGPHATAVIVAKKQGEMPAFDPDFHYAGTDGAPDQPKLTMWVADRLEGKAPRSVMESAAILGLLDSGLGGAPLQQVYDRARKDDLALGPAAADAWKNRRALCVRLTSMVDLLMAAMVKQRAADAATPH